MRKEEKAKIPISEIASAVKEFKNAVMKELQPLERLVAWLAKRIKKD